jgi:hypothetical protein
MRQRSRSDGRRVELFVGPRALDIGWRHFGDLVAVLNEAVGGLDDTAHATVEQLLEHALTGLNELARTR